MISSRVSSIPMTLISFIWSLLRHSRRRQSWKSCALRRSSWITRQIASSFLHTMYAIFFIRVLAFFFFFFFFFLRTLFQRFNFFLFSSDTSVVVGGLQFLLEPSKTFLAHPSVSLSQCVSPKAIT